jgi:hypothetical protein
MGITSRQLADVRRIERLAMQRDNLPIRKRQAQLWALAHTGDDWYKLPLMLMSRGCNADYSDHTEIAPDSVYELDDTGVYVVMAEWWSDLPVVSAGRLGKTSSPPRTQGNAKEGN